jgi:hypothetical protein
MKNKRTSIIDFNSYLKIKDSGMSIIDMSILLQVPKTTIRDWVSGRSGSKYLKTISSEEPIDPVLQLTQLNPSLSNEERYSIYSFILGLYLGDGCIVKIRTTKRFGITLDKKYDKLNSLVIDSFGKLFGKSPYVHDRSLRKGIKNNCIDVYYHSKSVGNIFPHEGVGKKHLREISIAEWQHEIIDPVNIVKGLIFSDGYYSKCRGRDFIGFDNRSLDICNILIRYLGILGINCSFCIGNCRTGKVYRVAVYSKEHVNKLMSLIGNKNDYK